MSRRVVSRAVLSVVALGALAAVPGSTTSVAVQLASHEVADAPLHLEILGTANLLKVSDGTPCSPDDLGGGAVDAHLSGDLWAHITSVPAGDDGYDPEGTGLYFNAGGTGAHHTADGSDRYYFDYPYDVDYFRYVFARSEAGEDIRIAGGPEGFTFDCRDVEWVNGQGYLHWALSYLIDTNPVEYYGDNAAFDPSSAENPGYFKLTTPDV